MKYYLIKAPICLIGIEEINYVELTEEELEAIATDKIRKVLKCE